MKIKVASGNSLKFFGKARSRTPAIVVPPSYTVYQDDFTGSNGDPPDTVIWDESDPPNNLSIQDNKLNYNGTESTYITSYVKTKTAILSGDFDTQFDFDITTWNIPVTNQHEIMLYLHTPSFSSYVALAIYRSSGFKKYAIVDGSLNVNYETTDTSGKLRIKRVGTVITAYVWDVGQSRWEWNNDTDGTVFDENTTDDLEVTIRLRQSPDYTANVNVDNWIAWLPDSDDYWSTFTGDDFTGTNGDPLNILNWTAQDLSHNFSIQNNKAYVSLPQSSGAKAVSGFKMSGDFDIQVDFSDLLVTGGALLRLWFGDLEVGSQEAGYMGTEDNSFLGSNFKTGGSWGVQDVDALGFDFGKFRLVRTGSEVYASYQNGAGGWTPSSNETVDTDDYIIMLQCVTQVGQTITANFDNFLINSGTVVSA